MGRGPLKLAVLALSFSFPWANGALAADLQPISTVTFKTTDGWTIAADYRPPQKNHKVVIMIHNLSGSRTDWNVLADSVAALGLGTLAFDMRGYGKSLEGPHGTELAREFLDDDWPATLKDVDAAIAFLVAKGVPERRVALAGSRVGANVAAMAAVRHPGAAWLLLLSPSDDIHGLSVGDGGTLKTLLVASQDDTESTEVCNRLVAADISRTLISATTGRGVALLGDKAILDKIVAWVKEASKRELR
jgi:pimeloyl-ACP methyl ester carboxylesterase